MHDLLFYIAVAMLLYCLFSARIGAWGLTMPMIFVTLGVISGTEDTALTVEAASSFHLLAEVTLALVLFADATLLHRDSLGRIGARTSRMLLIGLPLAILLGVGVGLVLLPGWPLWELCLLAALLAPTDAALGQSIQAEERIPRPLRDALNAESGLNDGLALPFVIFFAGLAAEGSHGAETGERLVVLLATQIGLGVAVGLAGGMLIGGLRNFVIGRGLMDEDLRQVATLLMVGVIFFGAEHFGGNAFVAVFVSGMAYANTARGSVSHARHFLEGDGRFLTMLSFFFIGALFVPIALEHLTAGGLLVVALSLLVVRPVAIWLSLLGTDAAPNERLFFGWFGPRGLATALFAVFVVLDFEGVERMGGILVIAISAVLVSIFVHGFTAKYASELFRFGPPGK
ncbi:cation:proton antiporter [Seohaeicola saemankumensis]|nr:cation:proton antiporter [Seohaeicola saemankumensis]MCA0871679.1 cation:proton antiporter [Seohaeicola saemankumensis]